MTMLLSFGEVRQLFATYLQENLYHDEPKELYGAINYILSLGGKRARPAMALMASNLYGEIDDNAKKVAMAIEVFHNFTLISDDIMDESSLRRGEPTVHKKYDLNTAILSGDAMMIEAINWLLEIDNDDLIPYVMRRFCKYAMEVCYGQQYDINFETRDDVSIDEYIEMIRLKTAVLLGSAMSIGAKVAGAKEEDIEHLQKFGENIGIAFQLQDDYLDTFGDEKTFGKRIGGDIVQNKKTYLYLKSLELADQKKLDVLQAHYSNHKDVDEKVKIREVTNVFTSLGVGEYATQLIEAYHNLGMSHLREVQVSDDRKKPLIDLAEFLLNRSV